ncbi:hypothetical protein YC2023_023523 [Brassica napus]
MQDVAHLGCARSRRDDLESSDVYINISDAGNLGRLSWQEYQLAWVYTTNGTQFGDECFQSNINHFFWLTTHWPHVKNMRECTFDIRNSADTRMIKSFADDKIFCGLGIRNNIGHNKVNVEKRCSNH